MRPSNFDRAGMIEVFKTDVADCVCASFLALRLKRELGLDRVDFDVQDCDHVLRVESGHVCVAGITWVLAAFDFTCERMV